MQPLQSYYDLYILLPNNHTGKCNFFVILLHFSAICGIINAAKATFEKEFTTAVHNYKYTWTKTKVGTETWNVRPYLVYTDSLGTERTVYGDLTTAKFN